MTIRPLRSLRFYEGEPGGSNGGGTAQGADGKSQGDDPNTKTDAESTQGVEDAGKETKEDDRLSRENARRRLENETLKAELAEIKERLESAETAKLTDTEKLQKEQDKLRKQIAEAEQKAKKAERLLYSSKAVVTHKLPEVLSDMLLGDSEDEIDEHAKFVKSSLEKWVRENFKTTSVDLEGGKRSAANNGKPTSEQARQHEQEIARVF